MLQVEDGQQIAAQEVNRRRSISEFWRGVEDLSPLRLAQETPVFWVFFARSQKLIEASHAPGGMFITVDKQTGHVWTQQEIETYYAPVAGQSERIAA